MVLKIANNMVAIFNYSFIFSSLLFSSALNSSISSVIALFLIKLLALERNFK